MDEKREPLLDDEPRYKKKSTGKGQPRSKHKHIYETVLLTKDYHGVDYKTGKPRVTKSILPTKVCVICGRIDKVDGDQSYYIKKSVTDMPVLAYDKELSEKALSLPKWYSEDYWNKFAVKMDL